MPSDRKPCDPYTRHITYSGVVTIETICIAFTMATSHDLEVKATDVFSVYVMTHNREKIYTVPGIEFGGDTGKSAIIIRVLFRPFKVYAGIRV